MANDPSGVCPCKKKALLALMAQASGIMQRNAHIGLICMLAESPSGHGNIEITTCEGSSRLSKQIETKMTCGPVDVAW